MIILLAPVLVADGNAVTIGIVTKISQVIRNGKEINCFAVQHIPTAGSVERSEAEICEIGDNNYPEQIEFVHRVAKRFDWYDRGMKLRNAREPEAATPDPIEETAKPRI